MVSVPEDLLPLLNDPNIGYLATVRPDGAPQVEPMWFKYDGETVRFTHTTKRAKYRNLKQNPNMALTVSAPSNPYEFVELRGHLVSADADPTGSFYQELGLRYSGEATPAPPDSPDRVILVMAVTKVVRK